MFGQYTHIPVLQLIQKKREDRSIILRYPYPHDSKLCKVLIVRIAQLLAFRIAEYRAF